MFFTFFHNSEMMFSYLHNTLPRLLSRIPNVEVRQMLNILLSELFYFAKKMERFYFGFNWFVDIIRCSFCFFSAVYVLREEHLFEITVDPKEGDWVMAKNLMPIAYME